ncbi:MAG: acyltransferase family protein, partial [Planctomycetota bacterium]
VNSMSLLRRRRPGDFLAARAIRIVPLFLIALLVNVVLIPFLPPLTEAAALSTHGPQHLISAQAGLSVTHVLANLTLMPHVLGYECLDPVMWTLQVEILFYGVLAGLFTTGALRRPAAAWGTLLALAWVACRWLDGNSPETNGGLIAVARSVRALFVLDQIPFFAIGYFLYRIRVSERVSWSDLGTITFSLFVLHQIDHGKFNPIAIMLIACLVLAAGYGKLPVLRIKPLLLLSTVSYPLYLLHNNPGSFLIHTFESVGVPSLACVVVAILFALSVAVLLTKWCEEPLTQKLRARYTDWRSSQTLPQTQWTVAR